MLYLSNTAFTQERIIDPNKIPENYVPQRGDYIINHFVTDFVGEYILSKNGVNFYMKLEKKKLCVDYTGVCYDRLYGEIEFKKQKKIIIGKKKIFTNHKITSSNHKNVTPQISSLIIDKNKTTLIIQDSIKNKSIEGILTKLENGKYSLKLKERGGTRVSVKEPEIIAGFTLPEEMILIKVE